MRFLGYILALFLVGAIAVFAGLLYQLNTFLETPLNLEGKGEIVMVRPGSSLKHLAKDLRVRGVIDNDRFLYGYARITGRANRIQAGEFLIPKGSKPRDLLAILEKGEAVQHKLTLIEGRSFKEIMAAINGNDILVHTLRESEPDRIMAEIGHPGEHPEGRFFPDTYGFARGTTDIEFLQRAYGKMRSELDRLWQEKSGEIPLKTPYEALILASIVEKETGAAEERPEIAGVFSRRLNKGMRLQTDPTVIYGMGDSYQGNIRRKDLKTDTPYNTYTRSGLPPTPICMPGRASIEAALNPKAGNSLYFVAKGDGSHAFSKSLKEHNRAVRKYQLKK